MWIVRIALDRPYTFIVLALLILIASPVVIARTPTDIFPNINIPVIAVGWNYTRAQSGGDGRAHHVDLSSASSPPPSTTSSTSSRPRSTGSRSSRSSCSRTPALDTANAQITAVSQTVSASDARRARSPPLILNFSASSVPILQLALSGEGLAEQELNDLGVNFLRTQLVTVPGAAVPYPYGGKQRQIMIDLNPALLQAKGLSPTDVVTRGQRRRT